MKDNLKLYHAKRNFSKTKEPVGVHKRKGKKLHFVIQHHLARKDHYDFRLEHNGVLKSWAVPKGPSYNLLDRRLAVLVEDHPLDYRTFEGTIPKGLYGGGTVMAWDEGYYEYEGDFAKDFQKGTLKFTLYGSRLRGRWTLVHFKKNNWLLIKERDHYAGFQNILEFQTSVRTGRTMEEIENDVSKKMITSKVRGIVDGILISHPKKLVFKNITKFDIALYYQKVYERMFPFLNQRLISTIRFPDGQHGETFFKKHLNNNDVGIGMVHVKSFKSKRSDYYYIKGITGLLSEVQRNSYEFHLWGSQVGDLECPNIMVFDLDPDEGMGIHQVRQGVRDLKSVLDELQLISFLKTSGGKGYHVVVPIYSLKTWEEFRDFAQNVAKLLETKWPQRYTSNGRKEKRQGKIFIDWIRNTKGATSVAPYSIRIRKKATVSMPISWSELDKVKPDEISIDKALKRLKRKDPWAHFFDIDQ